MKQIFKIPHFVGRSDNAVRVQVAIALIAYLLMNMLCKMAYVNQTLLETSRLVQTNLMQRRDFTRLKQQETRPPIDSRQMSLDWAEPDSRGLVPAMAVCAGDGRSSGLEKARCGDPDRNEYRAGLIQNPNAAFWGRDLFREFGDLAPYGAQAAEFDRAQRRNRLVVLYHLEIIALQDRRARRPTGRRRRVEPLRALPEWPKNGNLPGDYARQLVFDRAQPEPEVYRKLNIRAPNLRESQGR